MFIPHDRSRAFVVRNAELGSMHIHPVQSLILSLILIATTSQLRPQSPFAAQYTLESNGTQLRRPVVPDGMGGYRLFSVAWSSNGASGSVDLHLDHDGEVLSSELLAVELVGPVLEAHVMANGTMALLGLRIDTAVVMIFLDAEGTIMSSILIRPESGTTLRRGSFTCVGNEVDLLLSQTRGSGAALEEFVTVMKVDQDGSLLNARSYQHAELWTDLSSIDGRPDGGLLLAGATWNTGPPTLALLALDGDLNVEWSMSGPPVPYNVSPVIRQRSDGRYRVVWGDPSRENGGMVVVDSTGVVSTYYRNDLAEVDDVTCLPDDGYFTISHFDIVAGLSELRRYSADDILVWCRKITGGLGGTVIPDDTPGIHAFFSGKIDGSLTMERFSVDGTCAGTLCPVAPLEQGDTTMFPWPLEEVDHQVTIGAIASIQVPTSCTRTISCGNVGIADNTTFLRPVCKVVHTDASTILIETRGPEMPQCVIMDALGRSRSVSQHWSSEGDGIWRARIPIPACAGPGIVRLRYPNGEASCRFVTVP